jgi:hypothetical protein
MFKRFIVMGITHWRENRGEGGRHLQQSTLKAQEAYGVHMFCVHKMLTSIATAPPNFCFWPEYYSS